MIQAYVCDAIRTPFGRYGGALSSVRADDLAALPIQARMARNPRTGEPVEVAARPVPVFKPSKELRSLVAEDTDFESSGGADDE